MVKHNVTGIDRIVPGERASLWISAELRVPMRADITTGRIHRLVVPDVRVLYPQFVGVIRDGRAR